MKYISDFGTIPEAAMGMGYWVKGNTVYDITAGRHVRFIEENSELFGVTPEMVKEAFAKQNEKPGVEGKAREELVKLVASNGWLRVRHYEKPDYWSIQCDDIKRREHTIENFIYWCIEHKLMQYDSPAVILGYDKPEEKLVYDWKDGGVKGFLIRETKWMIDFRTVEERRETILAVYESLIEHHSVISEASLSRVLHHGEKGFMILSAFKNEAAFDENFTNSVKLRRMLKEKKLGFFELLGHWDENLEKREGSAFQRLRKDIEKAKELHSTSGGNTDVSVELSYFVPYTDKYKMDYNAFIKEGRELASFFGQFSYIVHNPEANTIEERKVADNKTLQIWKGINIVNISQAYSRMRNKLSKSFLYEGASFFNSVMACWAGNSMGYIMDENSYFTELRVQQKALIEKGV